ncbi:MAG: 2-oxoacid:ferredoxin oxidoreductase subunit beta [Candidatus Aminicenantes bacterium]|nr:2-oxoacid:ferredoxin oxidoreductase subunit beta [Candidatus Aminicenantes bacterium]
MRKEKNYHLTDPTWCKGCGIFGIFAALKKAAVTLNLEPEQLVIVTGIGCHGRLNNYFRSYGFHALHGRTLPVASGVKLSNPRLSVLGISGDGDAYSIGLGHFIHSLRRNINITYLVVDNRIYALTQGQTSPTSEKGFVSVSTPYGSKDLNLNGPQLALASGGSFIARGFSGEPKQLATLIEKGMKHNGFSLIEVLSPCVIHNKVNTYQWFKKNIYNLDDDSNYNPKDKMKAWKKLSNEKKIPLGLIYIEKRPSYEDLVFGKEAKPIVFDDLRVDVPRLEKIMEKFK